MIVKETGIYEIVSQSREVYQDQEDGRYVSTVEIKRVSNPHDFLPHRLRLEFRDDSTARKFAASSHPVEITVRAVMSDE